MAIEVIKVYIIINKMENNLMKYNIIELKQLYNKTNDDFKKFFITGRAKSFCVEFT